MSGAFKLGDVVVCIDNKPDRQDPKATLLTEQRVYRVATTGSINGIFLVGFRELPSAKPGHVWGWAARRFRKIDDEVAAVFRASLRSLPTHAEAPSA